MNGNYFVFAGGITRSDGGAYDFVGAYGTLEEAKASVDLNSVDWAHIAIYRDGKLSVILRKSTVRRRTPQTLEYIPCWNPLNEGKPA